jgi:hypothetical protein
VGLYVPGGKAVYPSSVVMNVVPAQVAGVASIAVVSPPQRDFEFAVHPTVLAAAELLGVDEVYAMLKKGGMRAVVDGIDVPVDILMVNRDPMAYPLRVGVAVPYNKTEPGVRVVKLGKSVVIEPTLKLQTIRVGPCTCICRWAKRETPL